MTDGPILICYDGSGDAAAAIAAAAGLLGSRDAVVLDVSPLMVAEGWSPAVSDAAFVDRVESDDAFARASAGAELARGAGFQAEPRADAALETWRGILEAADEIDAAAIVIGSRGLTGFRAVLEGSVSHNVAAHAGRPVLVVPPAA